MPIFVDMNMNRQTFAASLVLLVSLLFSCPVGVAASDEEVALEREVTLLMDTADSLHAAGRSDSAIIVARRADRLARRSESPALVLTVNSSLGVYLRSGGQVDEALACYATALEIATDSTFNSHLDEERTEEIAALYVNLAALHVDMSHRDQAAAYARSAAEWASCCDNCALQAQIYGVVGSVLTACGLPAEALPWQQQAYECSLQADDADSALRAAAYALLTCDRLHHTAEAAEWRARCRRLMEQEQTLMARLVYFQVECAICRNHGQTRESIAWFDSILALDGIESLPFVAFDCYNNLHQAYAGLHQYDSAYATLLKGNELRDSLYEEQKAESLRELTVKYNTKEKELALARSEAARANVRLRLAVALALLAVVLALFALYALRQRRRRHERELEFATLRSDTERRLTMRYVEGLENERARMARELHDGVCNDLTAIRMSLGGEMPASPALGLLDTCRDQVRRISHELMPPEFTYATIDEVLRYYVYKLNQAQTACRCTYESRPAEDAGWQQVPDALALEMYRIVQEAAGNAIRHSGALNVGVTLARTANGLELSVSDDGRLRHSQSAGIGLRTMRQRAAAVGGRLVVERTAEGTVVRLTLEIKD